MAQSSRPVWWSETLVRVAGQGHRRRASAGCSTSSAPFTVPRVDPVPVCAGPVVPITVRTDAGELSFLSTMTLFGISGDVTVAELAIGAFLPADGAAAAAVTGSAAALPALRRPLLTA